MAEKDGRDIPGRINFNIAGRQYYVVGEGSGLPAADYFHGGGNIRGGVLVRRDWDHSGDLKE